MRTSVLCAIAAAVVTLWLWPAVSPAQPAGQRVPLPLPGAPLGLSVGGGVSGCVLHSWPVARPVRGISHFCRMRICREFVAAATRRLRSLPADAAGRD